MRRAGARVGVGELLAAHRALALMPVSRHDDARLALRPVLCSTHADLVRFERAFDAVFGLMPDSGSGLDELGTIERAALPRAGFGDPPPPEAAPPPARPGEVPKPAPAAWSA